MMAIKLFSDFIKPSLGIEIRFIQIAISVTDGAADGLDVLNLSNHSILRILDEIKSRIL